MGMWKKQAMAGTNRDWKTRNQRGDQRAEQRKCKTFTRNENTRRKTD